MQVQEGEGWRLLVDPARYPFVVLVGGAGWAAELTAGEARSLKYGVAQVLEQLRALGEQLMAEEAITLEWDGGELWLELEGDKKGWGLRLVISPGGGRRGLEGSWAVGAAQAFAAALAQLVDPT